LLLENLQKCKDELSITNIYIYIYIKQIQRIGRNRWEEKKRMVTTGKIRESARRRIKRNKRSSTVIGSITEPEQRRR
jgi:hypothetical protein